MRQFLQVSSDCVVDPELVRFISYHEGLWKAYHVEGDRELRWFIIDDEYKEEVWKFFGLGKTQTSKSSESSEVNLTGVSEGDLAAVITLEFRECSLCSAKSGTPILCESCLINRISIDSLKEMLRKATNT